MSKPEPRIVDGVPMCSSGCAAYKQELYADGDIRSVRCTIDQGRDIGRDEPCLPAIREQAAELVQLRGALDAARTELMLQDDYLLHTTQGMEREQSLHRRLRVLEELGVAQRADELLELRAKAERKCGTCKYLDRGHMHCGHPSVHVINTVEHASCAAWEPKS